MTPPSPPGSAGLSANAARPHRPKRGNSCHRTVKPPRSPRTRWPTVPTCTRSSARTSPNIGHPDRQLHPAGRARGRPELLRVRRRRAVRDPRRQRRRRPGRRHVPVPVPRPRCGDPDTFLYNTGPIQSLDSPNWNHRQLYTVTRVRHGQSDVAGPAPDLPAVQHRPAVHAELRAAGAGGGPPPPRRDQGVRRPAGRGLLRGPRRDLRPRPTCGRSSSCTLSTACTSSASRRAGRQRHRQR